MKNLFFFLSFVVFTVVAWNKDESTTNLLGSMSANAISYNPSDGSVELSITMTSINGTTMSDQAWAALSAYNRNGRENAGNVYALNDDSTTSSPANISLVVDRDKNRVIINVRHNAPSRFDFLNPIATGSNEMSRRYFGWEKGCMDDQGMGLSASNDIAAPANWEISSLAANNN